MILSFSFSIQIHDDKKEHKMKNQCSSMYTTSMLYHSAISPMPLHNLEQNFCEVNVEQEAMIHKP